MPKVVDAKQRRSELAHAAATVIARNGIDGASLRGVAAEAGWTTGALVHYFESKRELLAFTLQTSLDRLGSRHAARVDDAPVDALRGLLVDSLPATESARLHWTVTLAFAAQAATDPDLATIQRHAYQRFRRAVATLVKSDGDDIDDVAAEREAERLIALVDGIALQAVFDPEHWTSERQIDALDAGIHAGLSESIDAVR